ncbi:MAG: hypothetical protein ACKOQS_07900 [Dolichospermum sp.]
MPAPQALHDLTLYLIKAENAVASIAIQNNLILVTGNTKHYQKIQALGYPLVIDNWRE